MKRALDLWLFPLDGKRCCLDYASLKPVQLEREIRDTEEERHTEEEGLQNSYSRMLYSLYRSIVAGLEC